MILQESKNDKVSDIISKMHKKYKIPRKIYSENLGKFANPFTGLAVSKNENVVGLFEIEGYKALPKMNQKVKCGDKILLLLPAAGG